MTNVSFAKVQFFSYGGRHFKPFLTKYPTSCPVLPYIYNDIKDLVRNVLELFVKYEVIEKCKTALGYKQIGLSDKSCILSKSKLNIGRAADFTIAEMKQPSRHLPA